MALARGRRARSPAVDAGLKWPNDLVVGDRKLAGILAERDGDALVVGAGCNVNWDVVPAPSWPRPRPPATSRPATPSTATRCSTRSSTRFDAPLDDRATRWSTSTGPGWRPSGGACASSRVRGDDLVGIAVGVTDDGALVVRDDAGTDHTVTTADVVHLR